jgi:uncharacterized protein
MKRILQCLLAVSLLLTSTGTLWAEKVATLPAPTGYINDFAGVLSPDTKAGLERLCTLVDRQAQAQIAVVTIKTIDSDQSIEEFATALEEKWKVGNKEDRGVLMLLVMTPRRGRIEVGYGLEGILNDAKVGDIGRAMSPYAQQGDYNSAVTLGVQQLAQIIATDRGVTLAVPAQQHYYHREQADQPVHITFGELIIGAGVILLILIFLVKTGNTGLIFFILGSLMGGGRGGGGYRGGSNDGGGGFGGFGGGSSGGGGASGDF